MESQTQVHDGAVEFVRRLCAATNAHDVEAVVDCFAADYRNETPAHPERGFVGREQVSRNWSQIFAAVPDVHAQVLRLSVSGDVIWTEWEHTGTRVDGSPHLMRGVIIFGVTDGCAGWARFYLEPVHEGPGDADEAVRRQVLPGVSR